MLHFSRLLSPGYCGTTKVTVETPMKKKKKPANGGGKEIEEGEQKKPRMDRHSLDGEPSGAVLCQSLFTH